MNPGTFNHHWTALATALQSDASPQGRLAMLCEFICVSRRDFEPRDQWVLKARTMLAGELGRVIQNLFAVTLLENFLPTQLDELAEALNALADAEPAAGRLRDTVAVTRILQRLYVGETGSAAALMDVPDLSGLLNGPPLVCARRFLSIHSSHPLAPQLKSAVEKWRKLHKTKLHKTKKPGAQEFRILLYARARTNWAGYGVLGRLEYQHGATVSRSDCLQFPDTSYSALQTWYKDHGTSISGLIGVLSCEEARGELDGTSHTLAAASLAAASI